MVTFSLADFFLNIFDVCAIILVLSFVIPCLTNRQKGD